jgi:hypothetical protein
MNPATCSTQHGGEARAIIVKTVEFTGWDVTMFDIPLNINHRRHKGK